MYISGYDSLIHDTPFPLRPHHLFSRPDEDHKPPAMFRTAARQAVLFGPFARSAPSPFKRTSEYVQEMKARYPPKKNWPPDFERLTNAEQLRFEKKYKRRLKLAQARPRWDKFIRLTQFWSITCKLASEMSVSKCRIACESGANKI